MRGEGGGVRRVFLLIPNAPMLEALGSILNPHFAKVYSEGGLSDA